MAGSTTYRGAMGWTITPGQLQKTLEEDNTSEAESEEELKEPGPSIDQQICLTPIA